jgi:hypothetical protein
MMEAVVSRGNEKIEIEKEHFEFTGRLQMRWKRDVCGTEEEDDLLRKRAKSGNCFCSQKQNDEEPLFFQ